jgi:tRNA threonylcarbamoyladenosine modification (KEOPS) complex  Pcc1 subunit
MTVHLELRITYPSAQEADTVFRALVPDNTGHMESRMIGNELIFMISAPNAGTMKNTADDLLACVKIAEEASGLSDTIPDLDGDPLSE